MLEKEMFFLHVTKKKNVCGFFVTFFLKGTKKTIAFDTYFSYLFATFLVTTQLNHKPVNLLCLGFFECLSIPVTNTLSKRVF